MIKSIFNQFLIRCELVCPKMHYVKQKLTQSSQLAQHLQHVSYAASFTLAIILFLPYYKSLYFRYFSRIFSLWFRYFTQLF